MSRDSQYVGSFVSHRETDNAILLSESGDEEDAEWVPFSQVSKVEREAGTNTVTVTMSEWIAKQKGFI